MLRTNLCYDYRVTITPEKIRDNPYQKDNVYQLTNVMRCNAKASKQNDVNAYPILCMYVMQKTLKSKPDMPRTKQPQANNKSGIVAISGY